jgi:hypothetical protein
MSESKDFIMGMQEEAYYPGHGKNTWIHKKITALTFTTGELDELIKNYRNRN